MKDYLLSNEEYKALPGPLRDELTLSKADRDKTLQLLNKIYTLCEKAKKIPGKLVNLLVPDLINYVNKTDESYYDNATLLLDLFLIQKDYLEYNEKFRSLPGPLKYAVMESKASDDKNLQLLNKIYTLCEKAKKVPGKLINLLVTDLVKYVSTTEEFNYNKAELLLDEYVIQVENFNNILNDYKIPTRLKESFKIHFFGKPEEEVRSFLEKIERIYLTTQSTAPHIIDKITTLLENYIESNEEYIYKLAQKNLEKETEKSGKQNNDDTIVPFKYVRKKHKNRFQTDKEIEKEEKNRSKIINDQNKKLEEIKNNADNENIALLKKAEFEKENKQKLLNEERAKYPDRYKILVEHADEKQKIDYESNIHNTDEESLKKVDNIISDLETNRSELKIQKTNEFNSLSSQHKTLFPNDSFVEIKNSFDSGLKTDNLAGIENLLLQMSPKIKNETERLNKKKTEFNRVNIDIKSCEVSISSQCEAQWEGETDLDKISEEIKKFQAVSGLADNRELQNKMIEINSLKEEYKNEKVNHLNELQAKKESKTFDSCDSVWIENREIHFMSEGENYKANSIYITQDARGELKGQYSAWWAEGNEFRKHPLPYSYQEEFKNKEDGEIANSSNDKEEVNLIVNKCKHTSLLEIENKIITQKDTLKKKSDKLVSSCNKTNAKVYRELVLSFSGRKQSIANSLYTFANQLTELRHEVLVLGITNHPLIEDKNLESEKIIELNVEVNSISIAEAGKTPEQITSQFEKLAKAEQEVAIFKDKLKGYERGLESIKTEKDKAFSEIIHIATTILGLTNDRIKAYGGWTGYTFGKSKAKKELATAFTTSLISLIEFAKAKQVSEMTKVMENLHDSASKYQNTAKSAEPIVESNKYSIFNNKKYTGNDDFYFEQILSSKGHIDKLKQHMQTLSVSTLPAAR